MFCYILFQTGDLVSAKKKLFDPGKATEGFNKRRIKIHAEAVKAAKGTRGRQKARAKKKGGKMLETARHMLRGIKKKTGCEGANLWEGRRNAVILAIAVRGSDDCVFMLYPKERSNTFQAGEERDI